MQKVKLGDIAQITAGQGAPQGEDKFGNEGFPFVRAGNLADLLNGKNESDLPKIDFSVAKKFRMKEYPQGSILFAKSGMSCMKGYVYVLKSPCYVVSHLAVVIPKTYNSSYLKYYFNFYRPNSLIKDSAYPSIALSDIANIEIQNISLSEQEAIAEKLDKVSILIEKRKQQLSLLDTLVKSKFVEMFENQKYPKCKIGDLVEKDIKSARKNFQPNEVIRYIDISSIDNKLNRMKGFSRLLFGEAPSRAQQCIEKGDILVSTVRPNLRNIAINSFEFTNMVASSGFCILRAQKCERIYLLGAVLSENFSRKMSEITTGANYPAIKDSDVLSYYIPNPPKEIQQIFAHFAEEIEKTKAKVEQSLVALELLKKSLMQKYFG